MKIYLAKISWTNPKNSFQKFKREFITSGETGEAAKGKIEHLLTDFVYDELRMTEISMPFEIF